MKRLLEEGNKYLCQRIYSFFELNVDFYFFNDNVFHFGRPKIMPLFKIMSDEAPRDTSISRVGN